MATKRPKRPRKRGEGSIIWRPERQKWMAQTPRLADGKRLYDYFDSDADAHRWLDGMLEGIKRGRDVESGRQALGQYLPRWLDLAYSYPEGEPMPPTRRVRTGHVRWVGMIDGLAQTPLDALGPTHFQQIVAEMQRLGRSRRTIKYVTDTLKMALQAAVEQRLIPENPVRVTIRRGDPPPPKTAWPADAVNLLLALCEQGDPFMPAWKLGFSYGPRISEIVGLRWDDIDFAAETITFDHALSRDGKRVVPTKQRNRRIVAVGRPVLAALKLLPRRGLWVFAKTPFEPWHADTFRARFSEAVERTRAKQRENGQKPSPVITPHGMRHTAATLMLQRGVPLPLVAEILGHASPNVTSRVYSHVLAESRRDAADLISGMIP